MKNSYSNIFAFNKKTLKKTINCLKNGNVAALPTETVYGLGGNAYSKDSINKIFKLKGRPKSNPLIVHYYNLNCAIKDIEINDYFLKLYKQFCPGPITFILTKKINSIMITLGGADTYNLTNKVIKKILSLNLNLKITVFVGPETNLSKNIITNKNIHYKFSVKNLFHH